MKVEDLILQLQDLINDAKTVPFSGRKVMVDSDEIFDIIDAINDAMPSEVRQAKNIVSDRKQILSEAHREADSIVNSANERKKAILNQDELVKEARAKAKEILDDAKTKSAEIRKAANVYADDTMKKAETTLTESVSEIRRTREAIANAAQKGNKQ